MHCKIVKAAKEMGVYTIVTDYLTDSPAKAIADKSYMYDVNDIDGIVEMCKQEQVNGVIGPYLDPCQRPYYEICHRLGLPCYIDTWEQVFTLTDKNAFKECCIKNGVDIIPTYDFSQPDKIEYPVYVKPAHSRGSRGQTVCHNFDEAKKAVAEAQKISDDGRAIIEKYMGDCSDFSMTYIFVDGEAYLTKTSDLYPGPIEYDLHKAQNGIVSPSNYATMYLMNVHNRVIAMLKDLGVKNGPVFMQGFVDGDTVRFYDPGQRFGGSEYDTLLKTAWGNVDIMKLMIEYAFTGIMRNSQFYLHYNLACLNNKSVITLFPTIRAGKISAIHGLDEISNMPEVVVYTLRHNVGEDIPFTGDVNQRMGEFDIIANNRAELIMVIQKVLDTLHVLDEDGKEMLFGNDIVNKMQASLNLEVNK